MSVKPNNGPGRLMGSPLGGWVLGMVPPDKALMVAPSPTAEVRK